MDCRHRNRLTVPAAKLGSARQLLMLVLLWAALQQPALATQHNTCASGDDASGEETLEADLTLPPYTDRPTEVVAGLFVKQIRDIDAVTNSYTFRGAISVRWCDPRLAFDPEVEGISERVMIGPEAITDGHQSWRARGFPVNQVEGMQITESIVRQRYDGWVLSELNLTVRLATNFDLRRFPFDRQELQFVVESFTWNTDQLQWIADESATGFAADFEIPEWKIKDVRAHVEPVDVRRSSDPFSRLTLSIDIERKSGFYLWKVLLPLLIIVMLSWAVFWMTEERFGIRVRASATGILTVVAYQFVANESLPRVAYLTVMDKIMVVSFVLLAITVFESFLVSRHQAESPEKALRIDRNSRWLFPLTYIVLLTAIVQTVVG